MRRRFRNDLAHTLWVASGYISRRVDSYLTQLKLRYWRIEGGRALLASGLPHFYRAPNSRITIGDSCIFLSRWNSNLHGLTRPCMISTLGQNSAITIGNRSGFSGTVIACEERIKIGDRVLCGANTVITDTDSHSINFRERFPDFYSNEIFTISELVKTAPVTIGSDVFIGMNTLILKGVTIGDRSVIGAGSIVTRSIPQDCIAAGVPARVVQQLPTANCENE